MTVFVLPMGDEPEEVTDFERWVMSLTEVRVAFFTVWGTYLVREWHCTPAFGGTVVCETESPEGYDVKFAVYHDALVEMYESETGKDCDYVF